jgi:hypothetical protein
MPMATEQTLLDGKGLCAWMLPSTGKKAGLMEMETDPPLKSASQR